MEQSSFCYRKKTKGSAVFAGVESCIVYNNSGLGLAHGLGFPYVAVAETLS